MLWLLLATPVCTLALGELDPFTALGLYLTHGGADARLQPVRLSPGAWDESRGDDLLRTLRADRPIRHERGVLLLGNSQQYTVSVARGGRVEPHRAVRVASDILADRVAATGTHLPFFNGAAPNQTMPEALWQSVYWYDVARVSPSVMLVQASFDTFRKQGVRVGYQTLLEDRSFSAALGRLERSDAGEPYVRSWRAAREAAATRRRDLAEASRFSVEGGLRKLGGKLPLYRRREEFRAAFLNDLYQLRVLLLDVTPTTRRHITGAPFDENWSAFVALTHLARSRGSRVLIYNAPVNPSVSMFYPSEYRRYEQLLSELARTQQYRYVDLSDAVPREHWGYWIDGPDPIHFNEEGHRILAEQLFESFGRDLRTGL